METPYLDEIVRWQKDSPVLSKEARGEAEQARAELSALKQRCADLELMLRAGKQPTVNAAPLFVDDQPGDTPRGWVIYYHNERELFIREGPDGLQLLTPEARAALSALGGERADGR